MIIPYNNEGEFLIQDRTGYKPPPWGYFGGSIEKGETSIEAVLRETREELGIVINPDDLVLVDEYTDTYPEYFVYKTLYIWLLDRPFDELVLDEGSGMQFMKPEEVVEKMNRPGDKKVARKAAEMISRL